jgi:glycosyltransferase involved in cell wall biosynthesis
MPDQPPPRDIVLLSTADWDNPFWTNKQHVAVELARLGNRVFYVESLGMRRPTITGRDFTRIYRRIRKAFQAPRHVGPNLYVWSPAVLPLQNFRAVRQLNRLCLTAGIAIWLAKLKMRRHTLWTYNPMTTEFLNLKSFQYCVYHCVDDIKASPGMPAKILAVAEEHLCRAVDIIFVTSRALEKSRSVWNANTHYLANVADFDHFARARDPLLEVPADLLKLPAPRIGFIGAISAYKLDMDLVCQIAAQRPGWSIILIGEVGEGDPWTNAELLKKHNNIHLLGPRPYQSLPAYLKGFDVAILPNRLNEYTKSMFPMKFFEYLAAGKSVVSTDLDALREFAGIVRIASDGDDFIAGIGQALQGQSTPLEARLALASQFTYAVRTSKMISLLT